MQLRLAGNSAARSGDLEEAEEKYTRALALNVKDTLHLLYSNRSGVRLRKGDLEGALFDAECAILYAPLDYATVQISLMPPFMTLESLGSHAPH